MSRDFDNWMADVKRRQRMLKDHRTFKEVEYTCECGHTQTIRYFADDTILPVTCCVQCRAGFSINTVGEMVMRHVGMFPAQQGQQAA